MQDLLLVVGVAASFLFGYFLVKRLDRYLEEHPPEEPEENSPQTEGEDQEPAVKNVEK